MEMHKHDPSKWNSLFQESWKEGLTPVLKRHAENAPMFEYMSSILAGGVLLEVGTGRGINSIIMNFLNPNSRFVITDYLDENIELLKTNLNSLGISLKNTEFLNLDIIADKIPNDVDLCFSDGVLEHFSEGEIAKSLQNQSSAKAIFVIVPCNGADIDYGDEWIVPYGKWKQVISDALPGAKIHALPIGHKNLFFRVLRKIVPFYKKSGKFKVLVDPINSVFAPIELRVAATVGFTIFPKRIKG